MYHDGLLRLQAKDYGKAQELLEAVLKDPLVSNAQVAYLIQLFSLLPFHRPSLYVSASDLCQFTVSVCGSQEENTASDGHLLQLRYDEHMSIYFPISSDVAFGF